MKEAKYDLLHTQENVLVRVPKKSGFMTRKKGFTANSGQKVSSHWQNGKPLTSGGFLNFFFYDLPWNHFGKSIVAKVQVLKKTMPDGREYTIVNVWCTPEETPMYDLKMPETQMKDYHPLMILNSNQVIEFRKLQ